MKKWIAFLCLSLLFSGTAFAGTKITLATCEWAPYFGSNLKNNGPVSEIATAAFKEAGYDAEIKFMDWNRAETLTGQGKFDGLMGAFSTEERAKVMEMSQPVGETTVVFFAKKGSNINFSTMKDLQAYKIGAMRGNAYTDEFDNATYLKKEYVKSMESNIKKLLAGRIDMFIESRYVAQDVINTKFASDKANIVVLEPTLQSNTLHIGVSKKIADYKKIQEALNVGLAKLKSDGRMDAILKSHGF